MLSSEKQLEIKKQLEEILGQLFNTLVAAFETESQQELEAAWAMTKQSCREHTSDLFLDGLLKTALKTKQFLAFERALFLMLCNIETLYPTSGKSLRPIIYALHRVLYFTRQEWQEFLATAGHGRADGLPRTGDRCAKSAGADRFSDLAVAQATWPALSTVHVPAREIGQRAGELLLQRLAGQVPARPIIDLGATLVVRGST